MANMFWQAYKLQCYRKHGIVTHPFIYPSNKIFECLLCIRSCSRNLALLAIKISRVPTLMELKVYLRKRENESIIKK